MCLTSAYKMNVTITDPNAEVDMCSGLYFILHCEWYFNSDLHCGDYGYYVIIKCNEFAEERYHLGYDRPLTIHQQIKWLEKWAKNYWNGKGDNWIVKTIEIEKE